MDVCWEVALPGKLGRMVRKVRPGKGVGLCEQQPVWKPKAPLWDERQPKTPTRGGGLEGGGACQGQSGP